MHHRPLLAVWALLLLWIWPRSSDAAPRLIPPDRTATPIPLTLLDAPYNTEGRWPSMRQSLDVGYAATRLPVWGIHRAFDRVRNKELGTALGIGTVYAVAYPLTILTGWTHEEWHRAVLGNRGISSRNGIFHPSAWSSGLIAVDRVADEDLARLKRDHPADTVRLMSAGIEGQRQLAERTGDHAFAYGDRGRWRGPFYFSRTWMFPVLQFNELNQIIYFATCAAESNDELTDGENQKRLTVGSRDFTGLDCTAFARDLHRPDEPYNDRGPHPYGEGIDRYVSWSDLSGSERRFVRTQLGLHFLSVLDPHLYGIDGFSLGRRRSGRWLAQVSHQLTPYGFSVDTRFSLQTGPILGFVTLTHGVNAESYFPGLRAQLVGLPLGRAPLALDATVGGWLQPQGLRFDARRPQVGGQVASTLHWNIASVASFDVELDLKSAGFVPGNVFLDRNLSVRVGTTLRL